MKRFLRWLWSLDTLARFAAIFTIVGFPILIFQIYEVRRIASDQNNIALNAAFINATNSGIIHAMEKKKAILDTHHGRYNSTDLDNYLGQFETINQAYRSGLLSEADLCTSFSYYIDLTMKNDEVKKYLADNSDYFSGLVELSNVTIKSKDENCR